MSDYSVVLVTVPDAAAADRVADELLRRKLAACVNQLPGVRSRYWWEGKIETSDELLLVAKTRTALVAELARCVRSVHPYEVPEIIAVAIADGYAPYLDWIGANTLFSKPAERPKPEPGV